MKEQHSDRVLAAEEKSEELSGNDLVMAMTLWDTGIPDEGPLAELREIFERATPADADADSGEDEDGCGEDDLDCDVDW